MTTMTSTRTDIFFRNAIAMLLAVFLGIFLPFPVLLVTHWWGSGSELIEESVKGLVVLYLVMTLRGTRWKLAAAGAFGLLFGFCEAMLYLPQDFSVDMMAGFWTRLLCTVPLHALTALTIALLAVLFRRSIFVFVGLVLAVLIHLAFNTFIGSGL